MTNRWVAFVLAGVVLVVVLVVFRLARALRYSAQQTAPLVGTWTQHAVKKDGRILYTYPSEAAKDNDPRWSRGLGGYSVARRMRGETEADSVPIGPWFRTWAEDFKTLQRKD